MISHNKKHIVSFFVLLISFGASAQYLGGNGDNYGSDEVEITMLNGLLKSDIKSFIYPTKLKNTDLIHIDLSAFSAISLANQYGQEFELIQTEENSFNLTPHLISGFYFLKISTDNQELTERIFVYD
jgi:hypothetical protein